MAKGRKTIDKEPISETISIRLTKTEMKELEEIALELDMPKTRFMRNVLLSGLEDAKVLHKTGALKGAKKLIDFKERFLHPEKYQTLVID